MIAIESHFDHFRTVFGSFRIVSDRFRTVSDGFGRFRIVFGSFRTVSDRFRTVFGPFSDRFGPFSDDSILNFKISNFNWPGLGHRRGRPPFRPVGADRRSEAGPSPGQLKFEILTKNRKTNGKKRNDNENGFLNSQHFGDVVKGHFPI